MANAMFTPAKEGLLNADLDLEVATIGAYLVRGYTRDLTDKFVSEITGAGGTLVAGPIALTGIDTTDGVFDADDVVFPAVSAGAACPHVVLAQTSAVGGGSNVATSSQRLLAIIDTATGLSVTPNGGDITVVWDDGTNKIFKLT